MNTNPYCPGPGDMTTWPDYYGHPLDQRRPDYEEDTTREEENESD